MVRGGRLSVVVPPQRVLALAAGAGGLERGVASVLDTRVICHVENEVSVAGLLVSHMEAGWLAPAPLWTDLRTFDGRPWRGLVDGITGGYPCQPFSVAGRQRGADDPRHLWPHVARIVDEVQPAWCFFENVGNHLRLGGREVLGDLQRLGYRTAATLYRAEEVGAPHRRERFFILAVADTAEFAQREPDDAARTEPREDAWQDVGGGSGTMGHTDGGGRDGRPESAECGETCRGRGPLSACRCGAVGDPDQSGSQGRGRTLSRGRDELPAWPPGPEDHEGWAAVVAAGRLDHLPASPQSDVRGGSNGLAGGLVRADRLRILGNGVVPAQAAAAFRELLSALLR